MQGFIVNDKATTVDVAIGGIGTSYALAKVIKLEADTEVDAKAKALPNAGYVSNLELRLKTPTSDTPESVSVIMTWDSAGTVPFAGPGTGTIYTGLTTSTATYLNTSIALDAWYTTPSTHTASGTVYMWVKINHASGGSGTVSFDSARLHWANRETI
tara:strand:+ start:21084 stop:21554 length:471 start_codon:yes stop_codon:yes gene_type:complete